MNKIKVVFVALAMLAGVGGAFATYCQQCENSVQYIWNGNGYVEAGVYGVDWDCVVGSGGVCTFYKPDPVGQPNNYAPCHEGGWFQL
ncbi:MAG: DUF6520 family protein [Niastella sp.]|jgi:hypothetical protein|uniref:DUF6520 family protein n=1 Tax=Niastella sp. TaxID=1869183 RepID=UPI00389AC43A